MTKCNWIIENFSEGQDIFLLIQAVKDAGHPLHLINRRTGFEYNHISLNNECAIFYRSINMAKVIKEYLNTCYPLLWDSGTSFNCSSYYPNYIQYLFNDIHQFTTVKDLKTDKYSYYEKYGKDALIFVRPDTGEKSFSGQLIDLQDFDKFFENSTVFNAKDDDIVIVSTPKNIIGEWRYIVTSEKKILSKSCYKYQGKVCSVPGAPEKATALVEKLLDIPHHPAKVFAIDVVQDNDGTCWLMEFNSFNSCGLYSSNMRMIVDETSRIAINEFENK